LETSRRYENTLIAAGGTVLVFLVSLSIKEPEHQISVPATEPAAELAD
jgi:hypothetical protein